MNCVLKHISNLFIYTLNSQITKARGRILFDSRSAELVVLCLCGVTDPNSTYHIDRVWRELDTQVKLRLPLNFPRSVHLRFGRGKAINRSVTQS